MAASRWLDCSVPRHSRPAPPRARRGRLQFRSLRGARDVSVLSVVPGAPRSVFLTPGALRTLVLWSTSTSTAPRAFFPTSTSTPGTPRFISCWVVVVPVVVAAVPRSFVCAIAGTQAAANAMVASVRAVLIASPSGDGIATRCLWQHAIALSKRYTRNTDPDCITSPVSPPS
ncbi:hypothetical protein Mpe_B0037 (plasmid) [Methylibium petroleiphilum PM1]|uniref:Uncharacterized protein n=1 Tax=Methylibium petroleiphilum (strain ATCC BAA-1232 / LMG 22953 / PM1) TaxID=420662 RepID=A2SMM9_METPP|nr:hypothetical protein Mpe_B0037 [Methylibium petroleiphilum PM1]